MFIASSVLKDGQLLVLGLSDENRRRLAAGQPINISRATHGMAVPAGLNIVIFAGHTEQTMMKQMESLIGSTTVINQKKSQ